MAFDKMIGIVKTVIRLASAKLQKDQYFLATCVIRLLVGPPGHKESHNSNSHR